MKNKLEMINGKVEAPLNLEEVVTGRKLNKFSKFKSREDYKEKLFQMGHVELCEELMRLGDVPSYDKSIMRNRCLALYDRAKNPRKIEFSPQSSKTLQEIIEEGK